MINLKGVAKDLEEKLVGKKIIRFEITEKAYIPNFEGISKDGMAKLMSHQKTYAVKIFFTDALIQSDQGQMIIQMADGADVELKVDDKPKIIIPDILPPDSKLM